MPGLAPCAAHHPGLCLPPLTFSGPLPTFGAHAPHQSTPQPGAAHPSQADLPRDIPLTWGAPSPILPHMAVCPDVHLGAGGPCPGSAAPPSWLVSRSGCFSSTCLPLTSPSCRRLALDWGQLHITRRSSPCSSPKHVPDLTSVCRGVTTTQLCHTVGQAEGRPRCLERAGRPLGHCDGTRCSGLLLPQLTGHRPTDGTPTPRELRQGGQLDKGHVFFPRCPQFPPVPTQRETAKP